jgi:hypothetical protein
VELQALDDEATYEYTMGTDYTIPPVQQAPGRELRRQRIMAEEPGTAVLLEYRRTE